MAIQVGVDTQILETVFRIFDELSLFYTVNFILDFIDARQEQYKLSNYVRMVRDVLNVDTFKKFMKGFNSFDDSD